MTHSLIYVNLASVCVQEHFSQMNDQLDVKVLRAKEINKPHVSKVSVNTILNNNSRINNRVFFTNGNGILATPVCEMITHVLMQYY